MEIVSWLQHHLVVPIGIIMVLLGYVLKLWKPIWGWIKQLKEKFKQIGENRREVKRQAEVDEKVFQEIKRIDEENITREKLWRDEAMKYRDSLETLAKTVKTLAETQASETKAFKERLDNGSNRFIKQDERLDKIEVSVDKINISLKTEAELSQQARKLAQQGQENIETKLNALDTLMKTVLVAINSGKAAAQEELDIIEQVRKEDYRNAIKGKKTT